MIQEASLQRWPIPARDGEDLVELPALNAQGIGSELTEIGVYLNTTQSARVVENKFATVFEFNAGTNPRRAIGMRAVEQAINTGVTVEQEDPRHAKAHPESHPVSLEQHELAPAIRSGDGETLD